MKGLAFVAFVLLAASATATAFGARSGQPPIFATPLAAATVQQPYSITIRKPGDVIIVRVKVAPGGSFGWHSHRSAVAVVVMSGTLTLYDSNGCSAKTFGRGQGFVEPANHVHLARNEGSAPVLLYATYLGSPHGANPNVPATQPTGCNV